MHQFSDTVEKMIQEFGKLPGVGRRSAERFAMYILKEEKEEANRLADAIKEVKEKIKNCSECSNLTDTEPCKICNSPSRDRSIVCVVEEPSHVSALEQTGKFKGLYHVLLGSLSPLRGVKPENLKINELIKRLKKEKIKEVIVATDSDAEGETTAQYLAKILKPMSVKISRPARGIPVGGTLEFASEETLAKAIESRTEFK